MQIVKNFFKNQAQVSVMLSLIYDFLLLAIIKIIVITLITNMDIFQ